MTKERPAKYEPYKYHYVTQEMYYKFTTTKSGRVFIDVMNKAYETGYYSPGGEYEKKNNLI